MILITEYRGVGFGRRMACVYCLLLAMLCGCAGRPAASVDAVADDVLLQSAITLSNDQVKLIVNPALSRIVWFGRIGGPNLLWVDPLAVQHAAEIEQRELAWTNWGGDKVWWGPQSLWAGAMGHRWPPDEFIDATPWRVISHDSLNVVVESADSPYIKAKIRRQITLSPDQAHVILRQQIIRTQDSPMPVQVWMVTQVNVPNYCLLDTTSDSSTGRQPFVLLSGKLTAQPRVLQADEHRVLRNDPATSAYAKIGTLGDWIAAVNGPDVFLQVAPYQRRQCYPEMSSLQIFACPQYVEIETLSPLSFPLPSQTVDQQVQWWLLKHDADTIQLVQRINAIVHQFD